MRHAPVAWPHGANRVASKNGRNRTPSAAREDYGSPGSLTLNALEFVLQDGLVVLLAVEDPDDGNKLGLNREGDHGPFLIVGDAQAGANVIALGAALGKVCRLPQ